VVQRVLSASVDVEGWRVATIGRGLLVLVGLETADTGADLSWMADKLANLRIFEDAAGKMNLSVKNLGAEDDPGSILLVPNFTLAGDARKGRRPSFDNAMRPEGAEPMFSQLAAAVRAQGVAVQTGIFRADMQVALVNDGPVTIWLDSRSGQTDI
jgi:D-tyrosyl-tRNA(Tyr) deacylase